VSRVIRVAAEVPEYARAELRVQSA
jgi:hypothetical protein